MNVKVQSWNLYLEDAIPAEDILLLCLCQEDYQKLYTLKESHEKPE